MKVTPSIVLLFIVSLSISAQSQSSDQKRLALIIGNGNYPVGALANPENDARAMQSALGQKGFDILKYENLDLRGMKMAIDDFGERLQEYDVGLFYYAGHGIQTKGYNYLIPTDAQLKTEQQIEYDCVPADRVLALMEGIGTDVNIIILDACRNNPFERSWTRSSTGRGLAFMNAPQGTLIAYATAPGSTASDGPGKNGLYTEAILQSLQIPDINILQMFQNVRSIVSNKSGGEQIPWESTSLTGDFYFGETTANKIALNNEYPDENDLTIIENTNTRELQINKLHNSGDSITVTLNKGNNSWKIFSPYKVGRVIDLYQPQYDTSDITGEIYEIGNALTAEIKIISTDFDGSIGILQPVEENFSPESISRHSLKISKRPNKGRMGLALVGGIISETSDPVDILPEISYYLLDNLLIKAGYGLHLKETESFEFPSKTHALFGIEYEFINYYRVHPYLDYRLTKYFGRYTWNNDTSTIRFPTYSFHGGVKFWISSNSMFNASGGLTLIQRQYYDYNNSLVKGDVFPALSARIGLNLLLN